MRVTGTLTIALALPPLSASRSVPIGTPLPNDLEDVPLMTPMSPFTPLSAIPTPLSAAITVDYESPDRQPGGSSSPPPSMTTTPVIISHTGILSSPLPAPTPVNSESDPGVISLSWGFPSVSEIPVSSATAVPETPGLVPPPPLSDPALPRGSEDIAWPETQGRVLPTERKTSLGKPPIPTRVESIQVDPFSDPVPTSVVVVTTLDPFLDPQDTDSETTVAPISKPTRRHTPTWMQLIDSVR
ncbi:hypothetical protein DFH07DRAFT_572432 [Mycena maculata]|uniref:Uncharacterized protein n=1 Tax=Mycena maculata TaxID=230809 RepID=A0AAD7N6W7_9AGAR|nr:hypothetical protein DFH07DRAFT_572432 [Mycena maculata]